MDQEEKIYIYINKNENKTMVERKKRHSTRLSLAIASATCNCYYLLKPAVLRAVKQTQKYIIVLEAFTETNKSIKKENF